MMTTTTCRRCADVIPESGSRCPGCGADSRGWTEYAWVSAACLPPALWLAGLLAAFR